MNYEFKVSNCKIRFALTPKSEEGLNILLKRSVPIKEIISKGIRIKIMEEARKECER